jgi:hypothetical protein
MSLFCFLKFIYVAILYIYKMELWKDFDLNSSDFIMLAQIKIKGKSDIYKRNLGSSACWIHINMIVFIEGKFEEKMALGEENF